jgi:hypothetical protein
VPLSAGALAVVRSHVGSIVPPSDADLHAVYDRLGSPEATALEVLRGRLADMLANPTKFSADGDFSESYEANIKALQAQIGGLEKVVPETVGGAMGLVTTTRMVRAGRSR